MLGYWRDPRATAAALQDGWLDTGDLATVDRDGYIYLCGRSNLLIKVHGHRVHPREIEDLITNRFAGAQAVVVPYDSAEETRLALFVVPAAQQTLDESQLRHVCRQKLPRHKIPSYVHVLDRFPLNDSLKVDRGRLAQHAADELRRVS
jgi:acyl-CoA synthetase (AMP-forming)/AMP-acid ligase II